MPKIEVIDKDNIKITQQEVGDHKRNNADTKIQNKNSPFWKNAQTNEKASDLFQIFLGWGFKSSY